MKANSLVILLAGTLGPLFVGGQPLHAQVTNTPDVVWRTNAHAGDITSLAFSVDSSLLASASYDGTAKLWRISDIALFRTFSTPNESATAVAVSPDGKYLAAGTGTDARVRLWNVDDGSLLWRRARTDEVVFSVAFSPDGTVLASATSEGRINLWSIPEGADRGVIEGHGDWVLSVDFSPDGASLASASSDRTAKLWTVPNGTLLRELTGHSNAVNWVVFNPAGNLLATGSSDTTSRLWRAADGAMLRILHDSRVYSVGFSSDGRLLATAAGPTIFWRVSDGQPLVAYPDASSSRLALSRDGKYFAYAIAGTVVLARMPLWISDVTRNGNEVILQWRGGSGRYQLQGRNSLSAGQWGNIGNPTTNTVFSHVCLSPMFYRVQSLTNAP